MTGLLWVLENVEEEAFGFAAAGGPDGSVRSFEVFDTGALDVKVDEEGELLFGW